MNFFDIGILEIIVILVVILLVVGPEKMPGYARKLGQFIRNFRKITSNLTAEFTKAVDLEDEAADIKKTAQDKLDKAKGASEDSKGKGKGPE